MMIYGPSVYKNCMENEIRHINNNVLNDSLVEHSSHFRISLVKYKIAAMVKCGIDKRRDAI